MSTKALRTIASMMGCTGTPEKCLHCGATRELEAIERAAKDLSRLHVGDFTYNIRDRAAGDDSFSGNTWEHPDVKVWSDAAALVDAIAKDAP